MIVHKEIDNIKEEEEVMEDVVVVAVVNMVRTRTNITTKDNSSAIINNSNSTAIRMMSINNSKCQFNNQVYLFKIWVKFKVNNRTIKCK